MYSFATLRETHRGHWGGFADAVTYLIFYRTLIRRKCQGLKGSALRQATSACVRYM